MSVITQNHILNIVPGMSAPIVVHVSQGDSGVELEFTLVNGDEIFDPTGTVISVHGIRQDGVGWGPVACARENGNIKFTLPDAATAVKGSGMAEISISNSTETVGTTNFAILVETATFPQGVTYANDVSVYEAILAYVDQMGEQSVANVEADLAAEIANRQAADAVLQGEINTNAHNISTNANDIATANGVIASHSSQIQTLTNNLSAETTARQNADSLEASTRSSADALLQAEIDQLVAPSGEAPSAAEVENARVGADGVTYSALGDAIREQVKNAMTFEEVNSDTVAITLNPGAYINTATEPVDLTPVTSATFNNGGYAIINCTEGDVFIITGTGASSGRLWTFINSSNNIISQAGVNATATKLYIEAPAGSSKLIINSIPYSVSLKGNRIIDKINRLSDDFTVFSGFTSDIMWENGYIVTSSATIDPSSVMVSGTPYVHIVIPCNEGDIFRISGEGGTDPRLWAFADSSNNRLSVASIGVSARDLKIKAPATASYLVVNSKRAVYYNVSSGKNIGDYLTDVDFTTDNMLDLFNIEKLSGWVEGGLIATRNLTNIAASIASPYITPNWRYNISTCQEGDVFIISGASGTNPGTLTFTDSNYDVLLSYEVDCRNKMFVAPADAEYIVINQKSDSPYDCYTGWPSLNAITNFNSINHLVYGKENMTYTLWCRPTMISYKGVRNKCYFGYTTSDGYSGVGAYDLDTGEVVHNDLKKGQIDDHNSSAVFIDPDGYIIVGYATGHNLDKYMHVRRSKVPECVEEFNDDVALVSSGLTSYCQFIEHDGILYMFYRSGDQNWAMRKSSDYGVTWSDEVILITADKKYYCMFVETTDTPDDDFIRVVMYPNSTYNITEIRQGFYNLDTEILYMTDMTTALGADHVAYSSFDVLISNDLTLTHNRLYDVAVSPANRPMILFARYETSTDGVYYVYDASNIYTIRAAGLQVLLGINNGLCWSTPNYIIVASGGDDDRIEIYSYSSGTITLVETVKAELRGTLGIRNYRPFCDVNNKAYMWTRGTIRDYTKFNTDIEFRTI